MNFGRVVFMSGVKPIKKMGIIKILGGQGQNINVTLSESKLFMRRVGGNETVPLFLSLTDGHTESITEINTSLDNSGRKNLQFEARIEPGLYPDVPEGKYSGIARFQNPFDLITYLQLNIPTEMNFGRVVFMSGVKPIKKMGIIKILGGQGQNINVTLSESKLFMRRVGGNETVPLFLSLTDGHTESITEINTSLDNSGRKNLQFEARIEPGLYPDVPEGKYSGIARFQVKYN